MSKVPSLSYLEVLRALQRDGWVIVRQKGSHIRVQKRLPAEVGKMFILPSYPAPHAIQKRTRPCHSIQKCKMQVLG
ncbi:type II toxin-antitoxin system HicA family toxin [Nitrospira sp. BLG_2]|uniref:type II toxin-antitoxin system HicA family toxin n=1 Tax=Nitrospira sp. BLG_2 TaxID=3397507 RepID=UPI003B9D9258